MTTTKPRCADGCGCFVRKGGDRCLSCAETVIDTQSRKIIALRNALTRQETHYREVFWWLRVGLMAAAGLAVWGWAR
jgi:hypothetical protein